MANPLITIGNELHGNLITREMTDDEHAEHKKLFANAEKIEQARQTQDAAKTVARQAVLDKLGLTADEADALFG